jgi:uncharacterized protein (DUF58 family)
VKDPVSKLAGATIDYWRNALAPGGRLLLIAVVFAGALGAISLQMPVYHVFCVLCGLYIVARLAGWVLRPRVSISGSLPERASAGQQVEGEFILTNTSWLPVYDLGLQFPRLPEYLHEPEPGGVLSRLGPGETQRVSVELEARKRGIYDIPAIRPTTAYPFNLCLTRGRPHNPGHLLVLPSFHPIARVDVPVGKKYQPGGIALTSNVGESPEYIGTRDYRPGDPYKRLDFRSWARLARPAVKEFQEEYYCRLALVVDTFVARGRRKGRGGFPELEAAISLGASVADALSRGEYIIDVFAAGPELYVFRAGRHIAHLENILEILACVDECRDSPFEEIGPAISGELANITSVICVFLDWDKPRANFVRNAQEAGCAAKVLVVRDGPTTEPVGADESWAGPISLLTPEQVQSGAIEEV